MTEYHPSWLAKRLYFKRPQRALRWWERKYLNLRSAGLADTPPLWWRALDRLGCW
jgi:hypothetical protein